MALVQGLENLGWRVTYSGARDVTQRVNEEWPDEDRIQGCESEVDEEESNHCS